MNNKSKKSENVSKNEELALMCQQACKNKQQIQQFYTKNKMKLPPILQSRNMFIKHLPPNCFSTSFSNILNSTISARKETIDAKPRVCVIAFDKNDRKRRGRNFHDEVKGYYHVSLNRHNKSNHNLALDQRRTNSTEIQKIKNKFVLFGEVQQENKPFPTLFHQISHNKLQNKDRKSSQEMLLPQQSMMISDQKKQFLSINRFGTINPQSQLLKTLMKKDELNPEQQKFLIKRRTMRQLNGLNLNHNFHHYNSARQNKEVKEEISKFAPWEEKEDYEYNHDTFLNK